MPGKGEGGCRGDGEGDDLAAAPARAVPTKEPTVTGSMVRPARSGLSCNPSWM